jgi:transcriptional regulator with PAS, ATPase and Fis domain
MTQLTVCCVYQSPRVGESIVEDLSTILRGHVKIVGQRVTDLESGPIEADYFIVPSDRAAEMVKQLRPRSRTLVSQFAPNFQELPNLLMLRSGTNCLVVAGSQETAENAVRKLKEYGFSWLNFYPYWPGNKAQTSETKTAITLGSSHLCPAYVSSIIDLGPRKLDIVTLIKLCLDLGLPRKVIDGILTDHVDEVTGLGRAYLGLYQESEHDRAYLKVLLDSTKDAIAAFDTNSAIMHRNTCFQRLTEGTNLNLNKLLKEPTGAPLVEQIKGKYFVVERLSVKVQDESDPVGTLLVLRSTEKVSEAEGAVRRALFARRHVALHRFSDVVGVSHAIRKVIETARKIAFSNLTVMIMGETGTGKELFAHAIHNASPRAEEAFVCAHFAAMPPTLIESELFGYDEGAFTGAKKGGHPGYFEQAHKGSIFLDEIGDAPLSFQSHLLRVLEDNRVMRVGGNYPIPIDVRLIAATNQDLNALVRKGNFREDLLYRLNVIPLLLPPLRSRTEDIPILARHFLSLVDRSNNRQFSPEVLEYLQNYSWPGNIRQLGSVVKYMAHLSENEVLGLNDLPPGLTPKPLTLSMGDSNEIIRNLKNDRNLVFWILDTLLLSKKAGRGVGKNSLIARAKEKGMSVSDYQMRTALHKLNYEGLIHIGSTSQGTMITDKGLALLYSLSCKLEDSSCRDAHTAGIFS